MRQSHKLDLSTGRLNWIIAARFANKWDRCCKQGKVYLPSRAPGRRRAIASGLNGVRYDMVRARARNPELS